MKLYKNLYISPSLESHATTVVQNMLVGNIQLNIYVIILTKLPKERIEIYNLTLNQQRLFYMDEVLVLGLARGHDEALEVFKNIAEDVYKETGALDMISYITRHQLEN